MSAETDLLAASRVAAGDDSILDVAIFHPRGFSAATGAGAAAGSAIGGDSGVGSAVGAALGGAAGMGAASAASDLPRSICVAISPERVYLMKHSGVTDFAGDVEPPFATLDRAQMGVEIHQRAMNRVVILIDDRSEETYEMEAPRIGPYHTKAAIQLLMMSEEHHEDVSS